jgi:hypothetical protein
MHGTPAEIATEMVALEEPAEVVGGEAGVAEDPREGAPLRSSLCSGTTSALRLPGFFSRTWLPR